MRLRKHWVGDVFNSKCNGKAPDKSVLDPNGRFVIVSGRLQEMLLPRICVYGPNWDDCLFTTYLFTSFPDIQNYFVTLGGDINLGQDPLLDQYSNTAISLTQAGGTLSDLSPQFSFTKHQIFLVLFPCPYILMYICT